MTNIFYPILESGDTIAVWLKNSCGTIINPLICTVIDEKKLTFCLKNSKDKKIYTFTSFYLGDATISSIEVIPNRTDIHSYFFGFARQASKRATCLRAQHGAVLVVDGRIASTGFNGSPPGMPHCTEVGCTMENNHCVNTIHAEENCLLQAAILPGVSTVGATLYVTANPCIRCAFRIANVGINTVYFDSVYGEYDANNYKNFTTKFVYLDRQHENHSHLA